MLGVRIFLFALPTERHGNNAHGKHTSISFCNLGNDWLPHCPVPPPMPAVMNTILRLPAYREWFLCFRWQPRGNFWMACAEAFRLRRFRFVNLVGTGLLFSACKSVLHTTNSDILDALSVHVVHGVASSATHTNHLDDWFEPLASQTCMCFPYSKHDYNFLMVLVVDKSIVHARISILVFISFRLQSSINNPLVLLMIDEKKSLVGLVSFSFYRNCIRFCIFFSPLCDFAIVKTAETCRAPIPPQLHT